MNPKHWGESHSSLNRRELLVTAGATTATTLAGCDDTKGEQYPTLVEAFFRIPPAEDTTSSGTIEFLLEFDAPIHEYDVENYLLTDGKSEIVDTGERSLDWYNSYTLEEDEVNKVFAEFGDRNEDLNREALERLQTDTTLLADTGSKIRLEIHNHPDVENTSLEAFANNCGDIPRITIPRIGYKGKVENEPQNVHLQLPDGQTRHYPKEERSSKRDEFDGTTVKYDFNEGKADIVGGETIQFGIDGPVGELSDYAIDGKEKTGTELLATEEFALHPPFDTISAVWRAHYQYMILYESAFDPPIETAKEVSKGLEDIALEGIGMLGPSPTSPGVARTFATVGVQARIAFEIGANTAQAFGTLFNTCVKIAEIYIKANKLQEKAEELSKEAGKIFEDGEATELFDKNFFAGTCEFFAKRATPALAENPAKSIEDYNTLLEVVSPDTRGNSDSDTDSFTCAEYNNCHYWVSYFHESADRADDIAEYTIPESDNSQTGFNGLLLTVRKAVDACEASPQTDQNYPMGGYSPRNTGYNPDATGPTGTNDETLQVLWETPPEDFSWVGSKPTYVDGTLYISASWGDGTGVAAIDAFSGSVRWKTALDDDVISVPSIVRDDSALYAVTEGVDIVRLDAQTGKKQGRGTTPLPDTQIPPYLTATNDGVYFIAKEEPPGLHSANLYGFNRGLSLQFDKDLEIDSLSTNDYQFAVTDELIVTNAGRNVVAFDKRNGNRRWEKDMIPGPLSVAADGAVFAGANQTPGTATFSDWVMFKRFSTSGDTQGTVDEAPAMLTRFCLQEESLFVGSYDGIYRYDRDSLSREARFPTEKTVDVQPQITEDYLYALDKGGYLSIYDIQTESLVHKQRIGKSKVLTAEGNSWAEVNPPLVAEGLLFITNESGGVRAFGTLEAD